MRFYKHQHLHYCGVDLHARSMYLCVLDKDGEKLLHSKIACDRAVFLKTIKPFRKDLVVAVECLFCWYWLADLCAKEGIAFALGHALYMKAVHGGKTKNDRIDSFKIAALLRGGNFPEAYVYPRGMRATRDLLRRRQYFVRKRAELLGHIQNTRTQLNLEPFEGRIDKRRGRLELLEHFSDSDVQMSIAVDMASLDTHDESIAELELYLKANVKEHDGAAYQLLRTVPGIGEILAMTIIYEIHKIERFPRVGSFLSYARLVPGVHVSAGKVKKAAGRKMGNPHLKWAFSEAAALFMRGNGPGTKLFRRLEKKQGKGKAMSVLAAKLGRAVYFMLCRNQPFDVQRFVAA